MEASLVAESRLASRWSEPRVRAYLIDAYAMSDAQARAIIKGVLDVWRKESTASRAENKRRAVRVLDEITRLAIKDGKLSAAVSAETLRSRIEGTQEQANAPIIERAPLEEVDEYQDRSAADLEYYASNGMWPEEAPAAGVVH